MTTSRGITDTKVYDREGVIERYGIPPELVPDFIGLKGDTSDNIPGVPGIGDKTAAELLQRFGSLEEVLAHIDDICGAKRKQNLTEHADDARISKELATVKRDIPIEFDLHTFVAQPPDRSQLRETFREFELREPLRRLEEALGSRRRRRARAGRRRRRSPRGSETAALADVGASRRREVAIAVRPPDTPEDQLFAADGHWRFGVHVDGASATCSPAAATAPRSSSRRSATGPRSPTTPSRWARSPAVLAHDTEVAAYLLEPARRGVPVPRAVRGARARGRRRGRGRRRRAAGRRARRVAARADPRARPDRPAARGRAAARAGAARHGAARPQARHRPPQADLGPRQGRGRRARARDLRAVRRPSSCSARPSSSRRSCSASSACRASAAARPATRPTRACSRRSATSTR